MRPAADFPPPPVHGYRGEPSPEPLTHPRGLCIAISREAGARGGSIAQKVGELLGWQVFDQETLDYLTQNDVAREQFLLDVPAGAMAWANGHFDRLQHEQKLTADPETAAMLRLILAVAARGDAVIVGRGAGHLLPAATTLHVRVVAPIEDRVAYFAQALRLSREEAARELRARDERRAKFVSRVLGSNPTDLGAYDLVINGTRLGIEGAAQIVGWAVRTKQQFDELRDPEESASNKPRGPR
jgi:cytidylate kinase